MVQLPICFLIPDLQVSNKPANSIRNGGLFYLFVRDLQCIRLPSHAELGNFFAL